MSDAPIVDIVAIDGPAGAGKSTVARKVAAALGLAYLDTGAMYRAATWNALHKGVDFDDETALAQATRDMALELIEDSDGLRVRVDGEDVSKAIRTQEVTKNIYRLDQLAEVRAHLVELQRQYGARKATVADGRDMGTVVFPEARCKIFLDASLDERALRRMKDLEALGEPVDFDVLRGEIEERDRKAQTRAVSPLRQAPDALRLDTTGTPLDDVVKKIIALARERL